MGRKCSLTLITIAQSTGKAIAAKQKSLGFLAKVVVDNRIVLITKIIG